MKKVLIVDDDREMTGVLREILQENNYKVCVAANGLEAIDISNKEKVDVILLDIRMPFFSGFWFCDAFKKRPQTVDIPVVIMSASSNEEDVQKAYKLGAAGYLKKPFQMDELLSTIEKAA
ncbi:MAG: response regulator [Candidatus Omnitrophica bacterium]|nr:response regulator [Candidatus Omnitrophota bacterium]